jgi:hypothetical protein
MYMCIVSVNCSMTWRCVECSVTWKRVYLVGFRGVSYLLVLVKVAIVVVVGV